MGLWKRGRRYWTQTVVNGVWIRRPLCPPGSTRATTNWQEAVALEKEMIRAALQGSLPTHSHSIKLFAAIDDYLKAKKATARNDRSTSTANGWMSSSECLATFAYRRSPHV